MLLNSLGVGRGYFFSRPYADIRILIVTGAMALVAWVPKTD
jgi:hypothetical protein